MAQIPTWMKKDPAQGGYHAMIDLGKHPVTGKRLRKHLRAKTVEALKEKREKLLKAAEADVISVMHAPTLAEYSNVWMDARGTSGQVTQNTMLRDEASIKAILPLLGSKKMNEITRYDVDLAINQMRKKGYTRYGKTKDYKSASLHRHFAVLRIIFNDAVTSGVISASPMHLYKLPSNKPAKEIVPFSSTEVRALMSLDFASFQEQLRVVIPLVCGYRQGEILGMRWSQFNEQQQVYYRSSAHYQTPWKHGCNNPEECGLQFKPSRRASKCPQRHSGGIQVSAPKDKKSVASALPTGVVALLKCHRAEQAAMREKAKTWADPDLIFTNKVGEPITKEQDRKLWHRLQVQAGVTPRGTHNGRRTVATEALGQGFDAGVVAASLGHSSSDITRGWYQHVTTDQQRRLAEAMGALVFGASEVADPVEVALKASGLSREQLVALLARMGDGHPPGLGETNR